MSVFPESFFTKKLHPETYERREDVDKYAHVATMQEIEENGFNLNIPRYVDIYMNLNRKTAGILIALFTGVRIGELCGLQMKDISLTDKTISSPFLRV